MLSSNYSNSVETELEQMIENLTFAPIFEAKFLSMQIDNFLHINTRDFKNTETTNKNEARKILLDTLNYYKKNKKNRKILIDKLKEKNCRNLEDFKKNIKNIIENKLRYDFVIGRGKKTKNRRIKKKETKRRRIKKKETKRRKKPTKI